MLTPVYFLWSAHVIPCPGYTNAGFREELHGSTVVAKALKKEDNRICTLDVATVLQIDRLLCLGMLWVDADTVKLRK